ncbi:MAG: PAS domain-containing protein, partial [Thermotogota bacterium]
MFSLEKAMEQSTIGFAKHQLIYDEKGNPKDYLFLSLNPAFERLTGLKREVLLNRRVTEVMPEIAQGDFDWFGFFGNIVTERKKEVFEHYSASLDKWYRVEGLSCEKDCFTTLFTDITNERELVHASKTFLDDEQKTNTYEEITQRMKRMTGADYVALNVFLEECGHFQTIAIVGIPGALQKAATLLGFNPLKKEWAPDPHRMALIREKKVTTFEHLHELTQHVLSKKAIQLLEKTFHLGQTVIIKSTQGEKIIGDFTLMFSKGNELQNENEAIIYADMVGMLIERRKGLQKLAEKETALREAKDNLQNITDNMLDLVSVTDMAGKYRFAGPSHKILGYEIDKLIGRNVMHFVHPEDLPQVEQEFVNFIRQKTKNPKVTYRYQRADGNYLWFETLGTFILDQKGEPKEILFNTRDITKQKEMEAQLQENQIRLEYAMDSCQHGFWDMNLDTDEIYCSPGYYKMLGYEPDEFPITPAVWRSFIHPDDRPFVPDIRDYLEKQEQKELYFRVKCKGNRFKWIASKAKGHERDSQGIPHRAVGVHVEVDELKQKNEALKEAHQMAKMGRWDYYHKQDHLQWSKEVFDLFELDSETFEANYKAFI